MGKFIIISILSITLLLGITFYVINSDIDVKQIAVTIGILDPPIPTPKPAFYRAVFLIFDPSGSGKSMYSVPHITTTYIESIIDSLQANGYGDLWITYIDMNGSNNDVLHYEIPLVNTSRPNLERHQGELKGDYDKRIAKYREDSTLYAVKTTLLNNSLHELREQFLSKSKTMIEAGYAPKKPWEDYSDVAGSINTALRSLETIQHDSTHFRSILLVSDGCQDTPNGFPPKKLRPIPSDIKIITVNHSGSRNNIVAGKTIELDNLDRGLDMIIKQSKN